MHNVLAFVFPALKSLSSWCMTVQVMDLCDEAGLDMGEAEYALLLEVAAVGASWEQVQRVLTRMSQELTVLQTSTLQAAEAYFRYIPAHVHARPEAISRFLPGGNVQVQLCPVQCSVSLQSVTSDLAVQSCSWELRLSGFVAPCVMGYTAACAAHCASHTGLSVCRRQARLQSLISLLKHILQHESQQWLHMGWRMSLCWPSSQALLADCAAIGYCDVDARQLLGI